MQHLVFSNVRISRKKLPSIYVHPFLKIYCTVMNPMVTRRVQNILQGSQSLNGVGVYPEHIEVTELMVHHELRRGNRQSQREIEDL